MKIEMLYFAWVREQIGRSGEMVHPPAEITTISALLDWLAAAHAPHAAAFKERTKLRAAIDQKFVPLDAPIAGAREIAIFPPVTGG